MSRARKSCGAVVGIGQSSLKRSDRACSDEPWMEADEDRRKRQRKARRSTETSPTTAIAANIPAYSSQSKNARIIAAAAEQRQLETINQLSQKFDYDGVDADLALHLLNIYWTCPHHEIPIVYRPAFMRDMACEGLLFSKLLLNAIFYSAAKFSTRDNVAERRIQYRNRFKELLGPMMDESKIETIQALLVMTNSLLFQDDEKSAAWLYSGIALRMFIDLRLFEINNVPDEAPIADLQQNEIHRRLFTAVFIIDEFQSLYTGRSTVLSQYTGIDHIQFSDTYEDLELFTLRGQTASSSGQISPLFTVSTLTEVFELTVLLEDILAKFYTKEFVDVENYTDKVFKPRERILKELKDWHTRLSPHLRLTGDCITNIKLSGSNGTPTPNIFAMHTMYRLLKILLLFPSACDSNTAYAALYTGANAFKTCLEDAAVLLKVIRSYEHSHTFKNAPFMLILGAYTVCSVLIPLTVPSNEHVSSVGIDYRKQSKSAIKTCLSYLSVAGSSSKVASRAMLTIKVLLSRLEVEMGNINPLKIGDDVYLNLPFEQVKKMYDEWKSDVEKLPINVLYPMHGSWIAEMLEEYELQE